MPAIPFVRLISELEILYSPPHRRKSTWKKLRTVLHEFRDLPGIRKTSDITPVNIIAWVNAHADRQPITNRSYLGAFRQAVKYAAKMRYLRVDPWEIRTDWIHDDMGLDDRQTSEPKASKRFYSVEQIVAYLDLLDAEALLDPFFGGRLQALSYTYALAALRRNEALGLLIADVDLGARLINLKPRRSRTLKSRNSEQPVPIAPELHAVLARWIPIAASVQSSSGFLFPARGRKRPRAKVVAWLNGPRGEKAADEIKAAGQRVGIPNLTPHSLRRSIATHGRRMGLSLQDMRDLLRHADIRTTMDWYVEEDAPAIAEIAERLSYRRVLGRGAEPAHSLN